MGYFKWSLGVLSSLVKGKTLPTPTQPIQVQPEPVETPTTPKVLQAQPAALPPQNGLTDPGAFFDEIREFKLFGPTFTQAEFEGTQAILNACAEAKWGIGWTAYALATAYHETGGKMQPVKELGGIEYLTKNYDITGNNPTRAREEGNTEPGDGVKYAGKGFVQLTWKNNYAKAEKALGVPLVDNPDKALETDVAAKIMIRGMSEGWFTGASLKKYIPEGAAGNEIQFTECRRIINVQDKAQTIALYGLAFQKALTEGKWK